MAEALITHRLDNAAVGQLLNSPQGGVGRDLLRRGIKVQNMAKRNLQRAPKRVDTGTLRSSINVQLLTVGGQLACRVSTNVRYALFVHDGTGLYGPYHQRIKPLRASRMRWRSRRTGRYVYAKSTRGMRPNPFLKDAMSAAKD